MEKEKRGKEEGTEGVFIGRLNMESERGSGRKRGEKEEDFGRVFVWIYRAVSKNYFL